MSSDLESIDEQVLADLGSARNLAPNIAENLGESEAAVKTSLERLFEHGIVVHVGHGLYELAGDWRARWGALHEPPSDICFVGATVYTVTEDGDDGGNLVVGLPEQTYGEWCDAHETEPPQRPSERTHGDGVYRTREANTSPSVGKSDVPVVETVKHHLLHDEGGSFEGLLDDDYTVTEALAYIRDEVDTPIIGMPDSDVYVAREAPYLGGGVYDRGDDDE